MKACEVCGGRRFKVPTIFRGTTEVEVDKAEPDDFEILDTDQGDGEWAEGPGAEVTCCECGETIPMAEWDPPNHSQDSDCTVGADGLCTVCGVEHGDPCGTCGCRGFHNPACSVQRLMALETSFIA